MVLSRDSSSLCDVVTVALGFASSLSMLNRDSLPTTEKLLHLCSAWAVLPRNKCFYHFLSFAPIFFQLHLTSSQEKGLHIHPPSGAEVLLQGRCFLSL